MNVALMVADISIILAFLGLIVVMVALGFAALQLKRDATRNAKRLYERPAATIKSIIANGQGVVDRSTPRVKRAADSVKSCASQIKIVVDEGKTVYTTVKDSDWDAILKTLRAGAKFAEAAAAVAKAVASQE